MRRFSVDGIQAFRHQTSDSPLTTARRASAFAYGCIFRARILLLPDGTRFRIFLLFIISIIIYLSLNCVLHFCCHTLLLWIAQEFLSSRAPRPIRYTSVQFIVHLLLCSICALSISRFFCNCVDLSWPLRLQKETKHMKFRITYFSVKLPR